ncbi:MAG: hypothetical protein K2F79_02095, partial [Muribaculaceae bacterium]|nr:hypothetical protein [Muribaculaceae bacterium]
MKSIKKIFLILLWTVMALVLAFAAALACGVRMLSPERLTPLVERLANDALEARVDIGRVELAFRPAFPMLYLQVDSLTVLSRSFQGLSPERRAALPEYADSLLRIDRLSGAVDVFAYLRKNIISLHDVEIAGAGLNVVMDAAGRGNFDIYGASGGPDTTAVAIAGATQQRMELPRVALDRFTFRDTRRIRYFNALDSTEATVVLLDNAGLDGSQSPMYDISIDGRLNSPVAKALLELDEVGFGLDGKVLWDPQDPSLLKVSDLGLHSAFIRAEVNAELLFDTTMVVRKADVKLAPVAVADLLSAVPSELRRKYSLEAPVLRTDATVAAEFVLTAPFVLGTDTIPCGVASVTVPDCSLRYGQADFRTLALDLRAVLKGNDPDQAVLEIGRLDIAGPATGLRIVGTATSLLSDASFDGSVKGRCNLRDLPPIVADRLGGFLSGRVTADLSARGSASMLNENLHLLDVRGTLCGDNLYYLSDDTAKMVDVSHARLRFGSQNRVITDSGSVSAPLLSAKIEVDTAHVLVDGVNMLVGGLYLGVGAENSAHLSDTTMIVPLGGVLRMGRFNVESVTDSAGMQLRGMMGTVALKRYKGNARAAEISADLDVDVLAVGTTTTRLRLNRAGIHARTHKIPLHERLGKETARVADSLRKAHPDLPMDSVYRLAIAKRRRRPGEPSHHRVHPQMTRQDNEVIEWGLSKGFRKFLLGWRLDGTISTRRARLFTPAFPLRNRISNLDIAFSNDTVELRGVRYRAGKSDLAVSGRISNIKRSLSSTTGRSSLKLNFDVVSDTLDVNQISAAVFAGAAYMDRLRRNESTGRVNLDGDDDEIERQIDALVTDHPDQSGPLLVPVNIDAELKVRANNIRYSDLTMTDLRGDVLMFGGALNLHGLSASSDAGSLDMSALYYAPRPDDMSFGFGLELSRIDIARFLNLVPAVDS